MDRKALAEEVENTASGLRMAIEKERRARHLVEVTRHNRRAADESILFGFADAAAEKAYGANEAKRKAQLRLDNATTYNAHKDAETALVSAIADVEIARVNFEEAACLARLSAGVLA